MFFYNFFFKKTSGHLTRGLFVRGTIGKGSDVRGACVHGGHLSGGNCAGAFVSGAIGLEPYPTDHGFTFFFYFLDLKHCFFYQHFHESGENLKQTPAKERLNVLQHWATC